MPSLSPLTILFYSLAAVAAGTLYILVRGATDRQSRTFGMAGIALISSLNAMSLLGGFSIGPIMALVAIALAVLVAVTSGSFQIPLRLLAVVTTLVGAGLWLGVFSAVELILGIGLGAAAVVAILSLARYWDTRLGSEFGGWAVVLAAALGGLGLVSSLSPIGSLGLWCARLGALFAAGLTFFAGSYRLGLVGVAILDGLLAIGIGGF
jgi:hypothetical protein